MEFKADQISTMNYGLFKINPPLEFEGKIQFKHSDSKNRSSAFCLNEDIMLSVSVPRRCGSSKCCLYLSNVKYENTNLKQESVCIGLDKEKDIYSFCIPSGYLNLGIYKCYVELKIADKIYRSDGSYDSVKFKSNANCCEKFQISILDFKYLLPKAFFGGIIYQVFVDRFNKTEHSSVPDGRMIVDGTWDKIPETPKYPGAPMRNNTFFGGTLKGIMHKLDYLAELGVSLLYLTPIFLSSSNHRYDTADYEIIDPLLGFEYDLASLINSARSRGIGIILDGVFNHTGADSKYFNKYSRFPDLGAFESKESVYYDWFCFNDHPSDYECWWNIDILPRLNLNSLSCRDYFAGENGIVAKYARLGIAGMRLDVADELPDDFIKDIKRVLYENGAPVLYGEVWEDASNKIAYGAYKSYYAGNELDGVMNYPLRVGLLEYIKTGQIKNLKYALTHVYLNAPKRIADMQMNLLDSHDTVRALTFFGDADCPIDKTVHSDKKLSNDSYCKAAQMLCSAYTILSTLPGLPTIFYGDEAGVQGYSDPYNRMPYPWGGEDTSILKHYKLIGDIRRSNNVFGQGGFNILLLDEDVFIFSRYDDNTVIITAFNNSNKNIMLLFDNNVEAIICQSISSEFKLAAKQAEIFNAKGILKIRISKE